MDSIETSPMIPQNYDWVTQTPEPSPRSSMAVPRGKVDAQHTSFQKVCHPVFEQMLACVASNADMLEKATPLVRHDLIHYLCQPFFERLSEVLYGQLSISNCLHAQVKEDVQGITESLDLENSRLILEQHLGFWDEASTDVEDGSPFVSLLSSDVEECQGSHRIEASSASQLSRTRALSFEDDTYSLIDFCESTMVCRHWKSKGFCRYNSQCKFLHPEHARGIRGKVATGTNHTPSMRKCSGRRRGGRNKL